MSIQIIKRAEGHPSNIETINRIITDAPQIAYNSEGRISIRIPQCSGDVLVVLDRPLSRELIRFVKKGITESPQHNTWCGECAKEFEDDLPF